MRQTSKPASPIPESQVLKNCSFRYSYAESEVSKIVSESNEVSDDLPDLPGSQYALGAHLHPAGIRGRWPLPRDLIFGSYQISAAASESFKCWRTCCTEADLGVPDRRAPSRAEESRPAATESGLGCSEGEGRLLIRDLLQSEDENLLKSLIERLVFRRDLLLCADQMDYEPEPEVLSAAPSRTSRDAAQGDSSASNTAETEARLCSSDHEPGVSVFAQPSGDAGASDTAGEIPAAISVPPESPTQRSLNPIYRSGVRVPAFRGPYEGKCIPVRLPDPSNYSPVTASGHDPAEPELFVFDGSATQSSSPSNRAPQPFLEDICEPGQMTWDFSFQASVGGRSGHGMSGRAFGLPRGTRGRNPRPIPGCHAHRESSAVK